MKGIDVRQQIIKAAEVLFRQQGYGKTSMTRIARDCGLSNTNLYRYFNSKKDIGAELVYQYLATREQELELIIANKGMTAAEKLESFVLYILNHTYHHTDSQLKLSELIDMMVIQRPEVIRAHRQINLRLLHDVLLLGQQSGEFTFDDVEEMAQTINTVITAFYLPIIMVIYPLSELEQRAISVCNMILASLSAKS